MFKKLTAIFAACLIFFSFQINSFAADGDVDPYFLTGFGFDNVVRDMALQPDGKLIVAGDFLFLAGTPQKHIARFKTNGNLDESFNIGSGAGGGNINSLKLLPNAKILIAGTFTTFNGVAANKVARLNGDGTFDNSFNAGAGANFDIFTATVQPDGKIFVGGNFSAYNGITYRGIARLNSDGSLDTSFVPGFNLNSGINVYAITIQDDEKILVGGIFSHQTGSGTIKNILRLDRNGAVDATFTVGTGTSAAVNAIVVQTDGNILIGGTFSSVNGAAQRGLARLSPNGARDASFAPGNINSVLKILIQPDGKLFLVGDFPQPSPNSNWNLLRLNPDGTIDSSFNGTSNGTTNAALLQSDGKIIIGGQFYTTPAIGGASPTGFIRLNSDGSRDASYVFRTGAPSDGISKVYVQPDGKILIVGGGATVGGLSRSGLARLNSDGTLDADFNPSIPYPKVAAVLPDNKIVVVGAGNVTNGFRLYRLNSDGSVISTFDLLLISDRTGNPEVADIDVQPDGKIILAGTFDTVNGVDRKGFVRFNLDNSIDASLRPTPTITAGAFKTINFAADGKILIGGAFTTFSTGATFISSVFRFVPDGTPDPTYNPPVISGYGITDLSLQSSGKILICGSFAQINSYPVRNIGRLNADGTVDYAFVPPTLAGNFGGYATTILSQPNGKYIIGGEFESVNGVARATIARINANNSLDTSFAPVISGVNFPSVSSVVQQTDGKLIIIGSIIAVNNIQRRYIARLLNTPKTTFSDYDGDGYGDISVFRPENGAWYLQQSTAGFSGAQFGASTDVIVPADYDGDGKTDLAVFRDGTWYLQRSALGFTGVAFGAAGDISVPADYDGDGKADIAVFRPSNGSWYLQRSTLGFAGIQFGQTGDKPVAADYDGDGKADIAVNRNGTWYIQRSQLGFIGIQFGDGNDKLVPADYDGDGKADVAVFRPSNGTWYLQQSTAGFSGIAFGLGTDLPVPADYDGDGKTDVAVFRSGAWYLNRSTAGFTGVAFGAATDQPVPSAYVR